MRAMIRRRRPEPRTETRAAGDPFYAPIVGDFLHPASAIVPPHLAENLSVVLASVNAIASTVAGLPFYVYRTDGSGDRLEDAAHPLARLIAEGPNRWQTWPEFVEWLLASTLLRGNGVAEIATDPAGAVVELVPHPWGNVSVVELPSARLAFDISDQRGRPSRRRLLDDQVLHLKDRTDDGRIGRSRLQRAVAAVSTALDTQTHAATLVANGARPTGAVMTDYTFLSDQERESFRALLRQQFQGPRRAGEVLLLDQGMKWQQIGVNAEDAELLASRRFGVEEIARLFEVPPPIIGDLTNGTFTNSETMLRLFAQRTLGNWITKLEAAARKSLFTTSERRRYSLSIDLSGLLRGDPETRWQSHKIAVESGILTVDEVREVEGWGPRAEGAG